MPLNILHHKSWNVYNTENIERVRRDEAKAKEEEQKKKKKAIQAEWEFRLSLLRNKNSTKGDSTSNDLPLNSHLNENGHVNLFYEEEQQLNSGKNEEREEEEKAKREKFESQFIYSLTGKDKEKPWYSLDKSSKSLKVPSISDNNNKLKKLNKDKKRKELEDPLELIKKNSAKNKEIELKYKESLPYYERRINKTNEIIKNTETFLNPTKLLKEFSKDRKIKDYSYSSSSESSNSSIESDSSSNSRSHKKRKHSKHHHRHSHHHHHHYDHKHEKNSKKNSKKRKKHHEESHQNGKTTIEKLREERMKREQEERQRALRVNGIQASPAPQMDKISEDKYFYNSQFNPESIRQLKRK
ncbi:hypothetical protein BCR36DRAFT_314836 [Piromyces finnis]|uniref:CBF1-interacting co-repressor CIR N-terminal domain-containing protein n=1 Tax=Piromyces finnis TaxID=1754191 RepID=A0A1Y1VNN8_9FUNG|nr:hypothetical protein BCR36DRAFT_314836 [Piromyces finnis]|eukprot:ORX60890.1 hypothetical protein BCR36DRAFT_314836 [Piromyces finnis]